MAVVVELVLGCVTNHCKFSPGEFCSDAWKDAVGAGVIPTGTVTVKGLMETRIPESRLIVAVAVFFLSASAVAVKVSVGAGLGKSARAGAVKVRTFDPLVVVVTQVPMLPPLSFMPVVQVPVTAFGFGVEDVGNGVYE